VNLSSDSATAFELIQYNLSASFPIVQVELAYFRYRVQGFYSILSATAFSKVDVNLQNSANDQRADY